MYSIKKLISVLFCLSLFACSSTEKIGRMQFSEDGYATGFVQVNYPQTQFAAMNKNSNKKTLNSDYQLMMSLLYRPITTDQAMMLAFAKERASYSLPYYGVAIKGEKNPDESNNRAENNFSRLIEQDMNAVNISAPR